MKDFTPEQIAETVSFITDASGQGAFITDIAKFPDPYLKDMLHKSILNIRALRSVMSLFHVTPQTFQEAGYGDRVNNMFKSMDEIDPDLNEEGYSIAHSVYPDLFPERETADMAA